MAESKEKLKTPLVKVKEETENDSLKLNIQAKAILSRLELEESTCLTSDYTTKLQSSREYGTGTKTEI